VVTETSRKEITSQAPAAPLRGMRIFFIFFIVYDLLFPPTAPVGISVAPDCSRALVLLWCIVCTVPLLVVFIAHLLP